MFVLFLPHRECYLLPIKTPSQKLVKVQLCTNSLVTAVIANTLGSVAVNSVIEYLNMYQVKSAVLHYIQAMHHQEQHTTTTWEAGSSTASNQQFLLMTSQLWDSTYWKTLIVQLNIMRTVSKLLPKDAQPFIWVSLSQFILIFINRFYAERKISYIHWNYFPDCILINHEFSHFLFLLSCNYCFVFISSLLL